MIYIKIFMWSIATILGILLLLHWLMIVLPNLFNKWFNYPEKIIFLDTFDACPYCETWYRKYQYQKLWRCQECGSKLH